MKQMLATEKDEFLRNEGKFYDHRPKIISEENTNLVIQKHIEAECKADKEEEKDEEELN